MRRRGLLNDLTHYDFWGLFNHLFKNENVDLATFYFAKLHSSRHTQEKSQELIEREAQLRKHLEQQGFRYITGGSVRSRVRNDGITFEEKGVDVRIAVDILQDIYEDKVGKIILASSDSDLQPVVYAAKAKHIPVVYLGFQVRPNRGLILTTDHTLLVTNDDIAHFIIYTNNQME